MEKICIIGLYFGKVPQDFELWLNSCKMNKTIDFLVFGDFKWDSFPANVRYIPSSLDDIWALIQGKLKISIKNFEAYKLCDFKPAYGIIFDEYVKGYDYWGHCDFDMIFGDIRKFCDLYELNKYNKFLPLGHLCFYKVGVTEPLIWQETGYDKNAIEIFQSSKNCLFDEIGVNGIYYRMGNYFDNIIFADIRPDLKMFKEVDNLSYYQKIYNDYKKSVKKINNKYQVFYKEDIGIYKAYVEKKDVKCREYMYIHMQKRNKIQYDQTIIQNGSFYICDGKLIPKTDTPLGVKNVKYLTKYRYRVIYDEFVSFTKRLRRFMKKKLGMRLDDNIEIPKLRDMG